MWRGSARGKVVGSPMERMARVGTGLVFAAGLAVLVGWYTGTTWLTTLSPSAWGLRSRAGST